MKIVTFIILLMSIGGCVGMQAVIPKSKLSKAPNMYYADGAWKSWSDSGHPENGSITLDAERRWCGVTLWLIAPVPLIMPVCRSYTKVEFEDNKPTKLIEGWTEHLFLGCGLGVWFFSQIANGEESFCIAE